jgi:hypothetical protein
LARFFNENGHDFWKEELRTSLNKKGIGLKLWLETGMKDNTLKTWAQVASDTDVPQIRSNRWEHNIKINFRLTGSGNFDWIKRFMIRSNGGI